MATANDMTLMGFNAIDLRTAVVGDVVVFRTGSLTHSQDLPLRHGSYARVTAFAKSSKGVPQVTVQFKDKTTMSMAPSNLVARTAEVDVSAPIARQLVTEIVDRCREHNRAFLTIPTLQVALGEMGMYDRLRVSAPLPTSDEDLPY